MLNKRLNYTFGPELLQLHSFSLKDSNYANQGSSYRRCAIIVSHVLIVSIECATYCNCVHCIPKYYNCTILVLQSNVTRELTNHMSAY